MTKSIKTILETLATWVKNGEIHSPTEWIDSAMELTALRQELMDEITRSEIAFCEIVERYEVAGDSHARATNKAKIENKGEVYYKLKYLQARDKVIDRMVGIAKQRSRTEDYKL